MSRLGKKPITVPSGVNVTFQGRKITVAGKNGTLSMDHRPEIGVKYDADGKSIQVTRLQEDRKSRAYHGMTRALIQNMITGVTEGFKKELEVVGVGWTAKLAGGNLELNVGYADTKRVAIPAGVKVEVQGMKVVVTGADRQAVGQFAAQARAMRKPEPYNGKGVKYINEVIQRKTGKAFGSS